MTDQASPREQLANRVESWLSGQPDIDNVAQELIDRDDGGPGKGRSITFTRGGLQYQLVIWNEKRLDFQPVTAAPGQWFTFGTEDEFYRFIESIRA